MIIIPTHVGFTESNTDHANRLFPFDGRWSHHDAATSWISFNCFNQTGWKSIVYINYTDSSFLQVFSPLPWWHWNGISLENCCTKVDGASAWATRQSTSLLVVLSEWQQRQRIQLSMSIWCSVWKSIVICGYLVGANGSRFKATHLTTSRSNDDNQLMQRRRDHKDEEGASIPTTWSFQRKDEPSDRTKSAAT